MSQQNSIIFICFCVLTLLSGCGVKKGLYQTPNPPEQPIKKEQPTKTDANNNKETSHYQQEKR